MDMLLKGQIFQVCPYQNKLVLNIFERESTIFKKFYTFSHCLNLVANKRQGAS